MLGICFLEKGTPSSRSWFEKPPFPAVEESTSGGDLAMAHAGRQQIGL
jgi:hypothetical protein